MRPPGLCYIIKRERNRDREINRDREGIKRDNTEFRKFGLSEGLHARREIKAFSQNLYVDICKETHYSRSHGSYMQYIMCAWCPLP